MDIQPQNTQPISDDQELAKVLAGVADQIENNEDPMAMTNALKEMNTPATPQPQPLNAASQTAATMTTAETAASTATAAPDSTQPTASNTSAVTPPTATPEVTDLATGNLDSIRKEAITDLKPIMDKLSVEPDEMFDLYLLLIRSTDDKALIQPAYAAAKKITDEARRAQALLDVIKEIDFLANK